MKNSFFNVCELGRRTAAMAACAVASLALFALPAAAQKKPEPTLTGMNVGFITVELTANGKAPVRHVLRKRSDGTNIWNLRSGSIPFTDATPRRAPLPGGSVTQEPNVVVVATRALHMAVNIAQRTCISPGFTCVVTDLQRFKNKAELVRDRMVAHYCQPFVEPPLTAENLGQVLLELYGKDVSGRLVISQMRFRKTIDTKTRAVFWNERVSSRGPVTNANPRTRLKPNDVVLDPNQKNTLRFISRNVYVNPQGAGACAAPDVGSCNVKSMERFLTMAERDQAIERKIYCE